MVPLLVLRCLRVIGKQGSSHVVCTFQLIIAEWAETAAHLPITVCPGTTTKSTSAHFRFGRASTTLFWLGLSVCTMRNLYKAVFDLGQSVFAHGQAYAALNRVKSLGVILVGLIDQVIHKNDCAVH